MPDIRFETGLVTYNLNGDCEVRFNPTDLSFGERLFETFNALDKAQQEQEADAAETGDNRAFFAHARERDQAMRQLVDGIFDQPVCEALFGEMNLYALADGLPVWCNLVLAVMDEVDTGFAREQKRTNPRLAKYTAKYKRHV